MILSYLFSTWMVIDALKRGNQDWWIFVIILLPFGEFFYFFTVKIHDFNIGKSSSSLWTRRNQWQQQASQIPVRNLSTSFELATVLILGMAKLSGEITREMKEDIVKIYQDTFHLSENQAQSAYTTASFLLKDEVNLQYTVKGIIRGTKEQFTKDQIEFLLDIIARVSQFEGKANEYQLDYFDVLSKELKPVAQVKW